MQKFYTRFFQPKRNVLIGLFLLLSSGVFSQTTHVVTTTADAGPGSLRQAILDANAGGVGGQLINFAFSSGTAPFVITLASPLPPLANDIWINGYTEPASVQGPIGSRTITVQINGGGLVAPIFDVQADNVNISGLSLVNSGGDGIVLGDYFTALRVWGNYIGASTNGVTGGAANAIVGSGVVIGISPGGAIPLGQFGRSSIGTSDLGFNEGAARENEGNVIGNCATGINSLGSKETRIRGNYIGIAANGVSALPISGAGILLNSFTINGSVGVNDQDPLTAAQMVNYVGNADEGITVRDGAKYSVVAGNTIGRTPTGAPAPIASYGLIIENAHNNRIGTDADGVLDAEEGNIIRGNSGFGLLIYNSVFAGGPGVPTAADSTWASFNTIMGNTIDSNFLAVKFDNFSTSTVPVTSNIIGSDGVGTNAAVEGNVIEYNFNGAVVFQDGATGPIVLNRISANSFDGNSGDQVTPGLSIVFNDDGVLNPIDCGDADAGPNGLLNRPIIDSVQFTATDLIIKGWVAAGNTLEFYVTSGSTDFGGATGPVTIIRNFGELKTFLFSATEGSGADLSAVVSTPSDPLDNDGTGVVCNLNYFEFSVPLSSVPGFTPGANVAGIALSAATGPANTSDYSPIILSVLPVTYLSFTGQAANNVVTLKWETATESNSSHFDVQRSADGVNFTTIGTVNAAGNSSTTQSYSFVDASPVKGAVSYYRLKQVDLDARFEYSKTILVKATGSNNRFAIAPNPVSSYLVINLVSEVKENVAIRLIDNNGRVVKSYNQSLVSGANQVRLSDLGSLPSGVYVLQIKGKSLLINEKIMK